MTTESILIAMPIVKKYEGKKLTAYLCPAEVWTIGYGSTYYEDGKSVQRGQVITEARAEELLIHTLTKFNTEVKRLVKSTCNYNQIAALTSFAFNVGINAFAKSTLLKKVNINPKDQTIANEFMRWNKAGGRILNGLSKRRAEESTLYFTL
jgi:lysozyme